MKKAEQDKAEATDLVIERKKLEQSNPGLVHSYSEFQSSFAQYQKVKEQFKNKGDQSKACKSGTQFRV